MTESKLFNCPIGLIYVVMEDAVRSHPVEMFSLRLLHRGHMNMADVVDLLDMLTGAGLHKRRRCADNELDEGHKNILCSCGLYARRNWRTLTWYTPISLNYPASSFTERLCLHCSRQEKRFAR